MTEIKVWYQMHGWKPDFIDPTENDRGVAVNKYVSFLFRDTPYIPKIDPTVPDIVFYDGPLSHQKLVHSRYPSCFRVYITGESFPISVKHNDFSLSYLKNSSRNARVPFWSMFVEWEDREAYDYVYHNQGSGIKQDAVPLIQKKFCSFIASNNVSFRNDFVRRLCNYKKVDCSGRCLNNVPLTPGRMGIDKHNAIRHYKFVVCFENAKVDGYVTEKIYHALNAGCIPIYWGSEAVFEYFNPDRFLYYEDYPSERDLMLKIQEIDQDDEMYLSIISRPVFILDRVPEHIKPKTVGLKLIRKYKEYKDRENSKKEDPVVE